MNNPYNHGQLTCTCTCTYVWVGLLLATFQQVRCAREDNNNIIILSRAYMYIRNLTVRNTVEPLLWDTSIQGTPPFRGHLHSGGTSIQGTPPFRGHLHSGDTSIQGTPPFRGHIHSGGTKFGPGKTSI